MKTLTTRLSDELRAGLNEVSRQKNRPVRDVVRESLRRYVAVEKFRALRKKALPFARARGFVTDADVFRAIS